MKRRSFLKGLGLSLLFPSVLIPKENPYEKLKRKFTVIRNKTMNGGQPVITAIQNKTSMEQGYVWAPYIPRYQTPIWSEGKELVGLMSRRSDGLSRYKDKVVNPKLYRKTNFHLSGGKLIQHEVTRTIRFNPSKGTFTEV